MELILDRVGTYWCFEGFAAFPVSEIPESEGWDHLRVSCDGDNVYKFRLDKNSWFRVQGSRANMVPYGVERMIARAGSGKHTYRFTLSFTEHTV